MRIQIKILLIVFYLIMSFNICINILDLKDKSIAIFFFVALQLSLVYEHGYKVFMKNQSSKILFLIIYIIPLMVTLYISILTYV